MSHSLNNAAKARFMQRASEYSTHASRRGINLLGWELDESLPRLEQLECCRRRVKQLLDALNALPKDHPMLPAIRAENRRVSLKIQQLRGQPKDKLARQAYHKLLNNYILKEAMETIGPKEWEVVLQKAAQRMNDDHLAGRFSKKGKAESGAFSTEPLEAP